MCKTDYPDWPKDSLWWLLVTVETSTSFVFMFARWRKTSNQQLWNISKTAIQYTVQCSWTSIIQPVLMELLELADPYTHPAPPDVARDNKIMPAMVTRAERTCRSAQKKGPSLRKYADGTGYEDFHRVCCRYYPYRCRDIAWTSNTTYFVVVPWTIQVGGMVRCRKRGPDGSQ